jgi:aminopeptidase N
MRKLILLIPVLFALSCQQKASDKNAAPAIVKDVHSFAEPEKAIVKHLDLELNVDFSTQLISGKASWTIENTSGATEIIFDSRQLQIQKVTLGVNETETTFTLGNEVKYLGQPLRVKIDPSTTRVSIYYSASKDAAAIQWLNPQQTAGKKYPFLFTQSQAILARTWIPCQDSPGIRFTYTAKISVPKDLLAVMSAQNPQSKNAEGIYNFKQPNPIPSYLMALAIGDLEFKSIGITVVFFKLCFSDIASPLDCAFNPYFSLSEMLSFL